MLAQCVQYCSGNQTDSSSDAQQQQQQLVTKRASELSLGSFSKPLETLQSIGSALTQPLITFLIDHHLPFTIATSTASSTAIKHTKLTFPTVMFIALTLASECVLFSTLQLLHPLLHNPNFQARDFSLNLTIQIGHTLFSTLSNRQSIGSNGHQSDDDPNPRPLASLDVPPLPNRFVACLFVPILTENRAVELCSVIAHLREQHLSSSNDHTQSRSISVCVLTWVALIEAVQFLNANCHASITDLRVITLQQSSQESISHELYRFERVFLRNLVESTSD